MTEAEQEALLPPSGTGTGGDPGHAGAEMRPPGSARLAFIPDAGGTAPLAAEAGPRAIDKSLEVAEAGPPQTRPRFPRQALLGHLPALRDVAFPLLVFALWRGLLETVFRLAAATRGGYMPIFVSWARWDGAWYQRIAIHGYSLHQYAPGQSSVAFFPLYPLLIRALARTTGLGHVTAAVVVSNACAFITVYLLHRLVTAEWSPTSAHLAVLALLLYPSSFFLVSAYAESLLLALIIGAILLAHRKMWGGASVLAALAGATAATGLVAAAVVVLEYVRRHRRPHCDAAWLLLAPAGTCAYAAFLWRRFGTPAVWFRTERAGWGRQASLASFGRLFARLPHIMRGTTYYWGIQKYDRMVLVCFVLVAIALLARHRWPLGLLVLAVLLLPASSGSLASLNRYALTAFPVFGWMGDLFRRRRLLLAPYLALALPLLILFTWSFVRGRWVG